MLSLMCLFLTIAGLAVLLVRHSIQLRRNNEQSWESLVARLRPVWTGSAQHPCISPEERWQQLGGAQTLCAVYRNSKVMLEMADYASRNGAAVDIELLANLRSDALQIRVLVAGALTKYALHQLNEGIASNIDRAANLYRDMSTRMGALEQKNAGGFTPQFVAAQ